MFWQKSVKNTPVYVVITLDVEEEGLFRDKYPCHVSGVANVPWLKDLAPLLDRGIKPTLFCAHSVFNDKTAWPVLENLRNQHGAEIGAHLHFWNTPPLPEGPDVLDAVPAYEVDESLLAAKLDTLFRAGRDFQGAPLKAFRMGRWDMHKKHWPLLFDAGVEVDSSIRPLYQAVTPQKGADHFNAPSHPYWLEHAGKRMLEVPLTVAPLSSAIAKLYKLPQNEFGKKARHLMQTWNTISLLPVYYPLAFLKWGAKLAMGYGDVLLMTWHSSEMMPGGAPHLPDAKSIENMLSKVAAWIDWLRKEREVRFVTLSELAALWKEKDMRPVTGPGDWHP